MSYDQDDLLSWREPRAVSERRMRRGDTLPTGALGMALACGVAAVAFGIGLGAGWPTRVENLPFFACLAAAGFFSIGALLYAFAPTVVRVYRDGLRIYRGGTIRTVQYHEIHRCTIRAERIFGGYDCRLLVIERDDGPIEVGIAGHVPTEQLLRVLREQGVNVDAGEQTAAPEPDSQGDSRP